MGRQSGDMQVCSLALQIAGEGPRLEDRKGVASAPNERGVAFTRVCLSHNETQLMGIRLSNMDSTHFWIGVDTARLTEP
jgi:hypothetical protein